MFQNHVCKKSFIPLLLINRNKVSSAKGTENSKRYACLAGHMSLFWHFRQDTLTSTFYHACPRDPLSQLKSLKPFSCYKPLNCKPLIYYSQVMTSLTLTLPSSSASALFSLEKPPSASPLRLNNTRKTKTFNKVRV